MHTVAVDLAKSVFQIAIADAHWKVIKQLRLTRSQFERWFHNHDVGLVIMEACGSAHYWGCWLNGLGIEVKLRPAAYIRLHARSNGQTNRSVSLFIGEVHTTNSAWR